MKHDAPGSPEVDAVMRMVVEMASQGFSPCVLVFMDTMGATRTLHREGIDPDEILRVALQVPSSDMRH